MIEINAELRKQFNDARKALISDGWEFVGSVPDDGYMANRIDFGFLYTKATKASKVRREFWLNYKTVGMASGVIAVAHAIDSQVESVSEALFASVSDPTAPRVYPVPSDHDAFMSRLESRLDR